MTMNPNERDVARGFGFSGGRRRIPGLDDDLHATSASVGQALGIRPGTTVLLAGQGASLFRKAISDVGGRPVSLIMNDSADVVVFRAESAYSLKRLHELAARLSPSGVLWVLWPQRHGHITSQHVRRAGVAAGFTDVHSARLEGMTALKFIRSPDKW